MANDSEAEWFIVVQTPLITWFITWYTYTKIWLWKMEKSKIIVAK